MGHPHISILTKKTMLLRIDVPQFSPVDVSRYRHQRPETGQLTGNFHVSDVAGMPDFIDTFKKAVQPFIQVAMCIGQQTDLFQVLPPFFPKLIIAFLFRHREVFFKR
jgi:hypothetical protein